jgi:DNA-binding transcriptional LysR family regulator
VAGDVLLRQLEYLVALAREEHFGRAAEACHASQPALSTGLHRLERELGVTLIHHGRRFGGFTAEGRRVLGWAHRILAERDGLHDDLAQMRGGLDATLRLGAIPTAMPMVSTLTADFCGRHPRARVRIEELSSTEIVRRLGDYTLDAGLTYLDPEPPAGTRSVELYREHYLLITPEHLAPLAGDGDGEIGWAEAVDRPLCALVRLMRNRRILEAGALAAGARLTPAVEADSVAALYAHAARGWSCIVAHTWLDTFGVPPGMRALRLPPVPAPPVGLLTAADEPLSMVAAALLETAQKG